ncbi:response regulator [Candidatus Nitrospira bockiana]
MRSITVVVADCEKRRRMSCLRRLRRAQGVRVVGQAETVSEAVAAAKHKPDILLLDLTMTRGHDNAAIPLIRTKSPRTRIILLTGAARDAQILNAVAQGARGYLGTLLFRRFLIKAVRVVAAGESWVPRAMVAKLIDRLARLSTGG